MNMKTIIKSLVIAAAAFSGAACTANYLEINSNPYGVTDDEMSRDGYNVRAALVGMANGVISPDVNTVQFTECLLGGTQGGYLADANATSFTNTISNFNPTDNWTNVFMKSSWIIPTIYSNYRMLHQVTDDPVILAVGDIIKVAAMHRVTDAYGPIPYSQIGQNGEINVPYDSQEDVYKQMFEELDAAIAALTPNRTNFFSSSADVIYGGSVEKWIKLANSLKLRLAMRIVYADQDLAREMAESAVKHEVGVMTSNDDNAMFSAWGTNGNTLRVSVRYNMLEGYETSGDSHVAADIVCFMNGYNDPRRPSYFTKSMWEGYDYVGLRRGIIIPEATTAHKFCGPVIEVNDPAYWMNAAEVAFLKAEAVAVFGFDMGTDARTAYEEGIRLSFDQYGAGDCASYIADNTSVPQLYTDPSGSNTYTGTISTITIAWDDAASVEEKQERIITQKWIANWLLGNEAWADFRRTGYPRLLPATEDGNKSTDRTLSTTWARRVEYPDDEAISNSQNYQQALVLLDGPDAMATRLWFDCKPGNPTYSR